ncbi:MAG: hypothetical protein AAFX94_11970, partial [Myxococcota bacterium]
LATLSNALELISAETTQTQRGPDPCLPSEQRTWFEDRDGDGFGDATSSRLDCIQPEGFVSNSSDCDDDPGACGASCSPAGFEAPSAGTCSDAFDNDCNGRIDDEDAACTDEPSGVYRSVGPGSVNALAESVGPLRVNGVNGRFESNLPNRVGLGDVLVYDSDGDGRRDALAFVVERRDSRWLRIAAADGGPPPRGLDTISDWAIFRAYTSLREAELGEENAGIDPALRNFDTWTEGADLVDLGQVWNIVCYADARDTQPVTISGWNTSEATPLRIFTPTREDEVGESQRHDARGRTERTPSR